MPLTIPEYLTIKTAAGATAAFLSPEADGLKECFIDNELNGSCTLTFSIPTTSDKKQYLTEAYRIYAPDSTGTLKEFMILTPDSIDITRDGKKVMGKITAQESWVRLGKDYVDPGVSNDPQTPSPPALAVIVLSGGSDLSGGLYTPGSAAHALHAVLQGTDWSVGTADQDGTHDLETEKISVLANIQKIQETWGGYLIWDSVNKTVSLRDETTWAEYTGYQIRYAKNLKGITRTSDFDIITKLYPFGEDDLNIGSVNGGVIYLTDNTYTAEVLEGIYINQDKTTAQELKDDATKYLAKVCKPRHNYRIDQVDLRTLSGYQHENFDVGHMVDIIDADLDTDDQARVIRHRFNVFQPWICELEVGDPLDTDADLMADSMKTVRYLNSIKTSKGQITAYKLVDESLIASKIAAAAVDASKLNTKTVILFGDTWTDNSPAGGSVAWNQHKLYYAGVEYVITAGNTAQKYIYWDGTANNYSTSATDPTSTLTDGQFIVAVNNAGLHDTVWDKGYAREFIGSALIADAAILSAHIGLAQILDAHIANLSANKIAVTDLTALSSEDDYTQMKGDGVRVYNDIAQLMAHLGSFEALDTLLATFTRASVAYKQDGTLVASGVPRYEYGAFYPAIPDDRALMIEEGTANLLINPGFESGNTGWTLTGASGIENVAGWEGNWRARINANGGEAAHNQIEQAVTVTSGQVYTLSIKAKKNSGTANTLIIITWPGGTSASVTFTPTTSYATYSVSGTAPGSGTAYVTVYVAKGSVIDYIFDAVQFENKAHATSYQPPGTTRANEALTIPATGNLSPTEGTWEHLVYVDSMAKRQIAGQWPTVFYIPRADGNTGIWVYHATNSAAWTIQTQDDGGQMSVVSCSDSYTPDGWHRFSAVWQAGEIALLIDGVRRITIANPHMPTGFAANAYIGSDNGASNYLNTLHGDLRTSSIARTDQEIADTYAAGIPLKVDANTTLKMGFDGTLQPTVRKFGLYSASGEIIGNLIKGSTVEASTIFGSIVKSCDNIDDDTYVALIPPNTLRVVYDGQTTLEITAGGSSGVISYFSGGTEYLRAEAEYNISSVLYGVLRALNSRPLALVGPVLNQSILLQPDGDMEYHAGSGRLHYFYGDLAMGSGTKYNIEETENFGKRLLSVVESPEQIYTDLKKAQLDNGTCRVTIDPIWLECIELDTKDTPWLIHLTPYADVGVYVAEIGVDYFVVKERNGGTSNSTFVWSLFATRKDHAHERLLEVL